MPLVLPPCHRPGSESGVTPWVAGPLSCQGGDWDHCWNSLCPDPGKDSICTVSRGEHLELIRALPRAPPKVVACKCVFFNTAGSFGSSSGERSSFRRKHDAAYKLIFGADVTCMQETHCDHAEAQRIDA
eukprot:8697486-Alexandrium_andersonii.AAC.1